MTRQEQCLLVQYFDTTFGPNEIAFAKAVVREQVNIAGEEVGDTIDISEPTLMRARESAGLDRVLLKQSLIAKTVSDCLTNRYLGRCGNGDCRGGSEITELIDELTGECKTISTLD